jgi:hypothetical protein
VLKFGDAKTRGFNTRTGRRSFQAGHTSEAPRNEKFQWLSLYEAKFARSTQRKRSGPFKDDFRITLDEKTRIQGQFASVEQVLM